MSHVFDTFRAACSWAVKTQKLSDHPTRGIDAPKRLRLEHKTVDAVAFARLADAAKTTDLANVVVVAIGTGMRRGELLGLRWGDVDLEAGIVRVRRSVEVVAGKRREKSGPTERWRSSGPWLKHLARKRLHSVRNALGLPADKCAPIFDRADGTPWQPDQFSWHFRELAKRAKVAIRFHDLRYSFASISFASGADLKAISSALGHSTIATNANTYLHQDKSMPRLMRQF